ncbi:biotin/lipoyl-binding protein [bacterium]|nr:biotin/lipoyl-binding protein [bacterium]NUN46724.1 biotin/lipoyl-binding protein [bacterium]
MKYKVTTEQKEYDIEVVPQGASFKVRVGKSPDIEELDVDFHTVGQGSVHSMLVNDKSYRVIIDKKMHKHAVYTRRHRFEFNVEDERTFLMRSLIAGSGAKAAGEVKAPIPGLVSKLLLQEGDTVNQGQGVLILEAMKMENEIKAPMAGKIKKFHVQGGKNVEKGQPLFVVEP